MKKDYFLGSLIFTLMGMLPISSFADNSNTIEYSGTLIALPCTVEPSEQNDFVWFGENINSKDLYTGLRVDREFEFYLKDCDTSLGNSISAEFKGQNVTQDGFLKVDSISEATGVVIGLETMSGKPLPINGVKVEPIYPIKDGDMTITVRSYLKGDPEAIKNRTITPGWFNATLTYTLVYE
ncbi:fimbrial protein [Providencia manganoxydans]|uniref:fimbrial protein n=1 Tax=Providencia manganoxydans TaxID=2923283 RepID=UPI0029409AE6|nr:type 1 fimbrial protein [Providencia stuartii]ELR5081128.1 type 1 fimbrial protein [Providencia stuartii]